MSEKMKSTRKAPAGPEVTQWFRYDEKPHPRRPGYYEVRNDGTLTLGHPKYLNDAPGVSGSPDRNVRYWDGQRWRVAPNLWFSMMGSHASQQWRGLAVKP